MASLMASLGIDRLSLDDQVQLVEEILDSLLEQQQTATIAESQRHELDRRIAEIDSGAARLTSWNVVEARVLAMLKP